VGRQRLTLASRRRPPVRSSSLGVHRRGPASTLNEIGDAEFEVEKERTLQRERKGAREAAAVERGPKTVAGAAEVVADGGGCKDRD